MPRYTAQQEFQFKLADVEVALIPDAGTSVTIEYYNGLEWVADSLSPSTTPDIIFVKELRVRLTPDVGGFLFEAERYELN